MRDNGIKECRVIAAPLVEEVFADVYLTGLTKHNYPLRDNLAGKTTAQTHELI